MESSHGHLSNWANELEDFQSDADKVLANAKKEQEELEADKAKKKSGDSGAYSDKGTDEDPLQKYRPQLDRITGDRHKRAAHYAGKIGEQLDDVIEDSWWDNVKGWIHDNIDAIKFVLDALGWVAAVLGFIALFIPGLNVLVIGISIFIAASRFLMYLAGEASLAEVTVDCIGLVTMALGVGMLSKLKVANNAVKAASKAQRLSRLKAAVRANKSALRVSSGLSRRPPMTD
ncbi:hypothetical protein [Streptomyces sp. NPDC001480]|uniref:hypothetical protein n=1 Tax=Streptomyces sp. NPDC001480 TaxID=3364577 RepID=UPI00367E0A55